MSLPDSNDLSDITCPKCGGHYPGFEPPGGDVCECWENANSRFADGIIWGMFALSLIVALALLIIVFLS